MTLRAVLQGAQPDPYVFPEQERSEAACPDSQEFDEAPTAVGGVQKRVFGLSAGKTE